MNRLVRDRSSWLLPESSSANSTSSLTHEPDANFSADFYNVVGLFRSWLLSTN